MSAPPSLAGVTLCLNPTTSVFVSGVPGSTPSTLADRLYSELKSFLHSQGVRFVEAPGCSKSPAALTLFLNVTPVRGSSAVETLVSGRVSNEVQATGVWFSNSPLRWSGVKYGQVSPGETAIRLRLLEDARFMFAQFVEDWQAANP
ncbi:hypothetical protein E7T06_17765 [Deinococcus sp. Arct2-2]|uniref:hypothetical protein n=1 Tax=Deinococcus sp. Arct2-2 TaxID=2568653 RepID=UPI0010A4D03A|nr:hypothetical protein [Deinococcus sp. Arct2-2]THF68181.1 hypothetical protein E7T06_17765 [Deinococcus sp. Arct2-2]